MAEEQVVTPVADATPVAGVEGTPTPVTQREYTETEQRAMAQGWVPEDQYDGPQKWRDADSFLDRGELFAKIDESKRHNRQLEATVQELKRHYKKVQETEFRRAIAQLRAKKIEALDTADSAQVVAIEDQIDAVKREAVMTMRQMDAPTPAEQAVNPALQVWINRNPWYEQNQAMKIFADSLGTELAAKGMYDPLQILQEVERITKKEFAHKFTNPNRARPSGVEGGGARGASKADDFQLTAEETQVMNRFIKAKVLTKEEYIRDIKEQRGVK